MGEQETQKLPETLPKDRSWEHNPPHFLRVHLEHSWYYPKILPTPLLSGQHPLYLSVVLQDCLPKECYKSSKAVSTIGWKILNLILRSRIFDIDYLWSISFRKITRICNEYPIMFKEIWYWLSVKYIIHKNNKNLQLIPYHSIQDSETQTPPVAWMMMLH